MDIVSLMPGFNLPFPFGTLYASSSDGSYFSACLEYTNRDLTTGLVDFEHIQASMHEGVLLANVVKNWEQIVHRDTIFKQLSTKMSFDNGRSWSLITAPKRDSKGNPFDCSPSGDQDESCSLHLHSVTTSRNVGRVFSVSSAPGIIIGVGNVGSSLRPYTECDTFLSDNSGVTWREVQKGSHKFEILNFGSILVLVPDGDTPVTSILYSKDRGKSWLAYAVKIKDNSWSPRFTTVDPASKSRKMIISASKVPSDRKQYFLQLNFEPEFTRKCDSNDIEAWDMKGKGDYCVLGTIWQFQRRKEAADCYMDPNFVVAPQPSHPCPCTDLDYECDLGFVRSDSQGKLSCIAIKEIHDQPIDCKAGSKYKGLSGYRFIPGTKCQGGNDKLAEPAMKDCKTDPGSGTPPSEPKNSKFEFESHIVEMAEIPGTSLIYVLLENAQVWRSSDFGSKWKRLNFPGEVPVFKFFPHESEKNRLVFMSSSKIFIVKDAELEDLPMVNELNVPENFNSFGIPILDIHPTEPDWYTFVGGGADCSSTTACHATAYLTKDSGKTWSKVQTWVTKCAWAKDVYFEGDKLPKDAIFCTSFKNKAGNVGQDRLPISKANPLVFEKILEGKSTVLLDKNVLQFFVDYSLILVVTGDLTSPDLYSSIDGVNFEMIRLPTGVILDQQKITLLESNMTGIFAAVKSHIVMGQEYGTLLKSSVNGKYFSKVIGAVNQNPAGLTDFQTIPGSFLTALTNIVKNAKNIQSQVGKVLSSLISFDGGISWTSLKPPAVDSLGNTIQCDAKDECSLHLNLRAGTSAFGKIMNPYGSEETAGIILGVGNWGKNLIEYERGNLFLSADGGRSFKEVIKGPHLWSLSERGSLLIALLDGQYTSTLTYSWNYGQSWASYTFAAVPILVEMLIGFETDPHVVLSGHRQTDSKTIVYHLDFSSLFQRKCELADTEVVSFKSNLCILGVKYNINRRKLTSACSLGPSFRTVNNANAFCDCEERDYECIDQYFRNEVGQCSPLGIDPYQPSNCKKGESYQGRSGYQKLPVDKCHGGIDLTLPVEKKCGDKSSGPEIVGIRTFKFDGDIDDYFYFKESPRIIAKDIKHNCYISKDEGASWGKIPDVGSIVSIVNDEHFKDRAFLFADGLGMFMTNDQGDTFKKIELQGLVNLNVAPRPLVTHPNHREWLIWIGAEKCKIGEDFCHTVGLVSWDSGDSWSEFAQYVNYCVWAASPGFHSLSERAFFCAVSDTLRGDQRSISNYVLKRYDDGSSTNTELLKINAFAAEDSYLIASVVIFTDLGRFTEAGSKNQDFE